MCQAQLMELAGSKSVVIYVNRHVKINGFMILPKFAAEFWKKMGFDSE